MKWNMNKNSIPKETLDSIIAELNSADNKAVAIINATQRIVEFQTADLAEQIANEAAMASENATYRNSLGLRVLSAEENKFYDTLKNVRQAVTANQPAVIPTSIIDKTLADLHDESNIMKLINLAPADVKRWITGSHSGAAIWGDILSVTQLTSELTANLAAVDFEQNMLTAFFVIPKAIKDIGNEYADRYFTAVLAEVMRDGIIKGYLYGTGKNAPVGIACQLGAKSAVSGHTDEQAAKTKLTNITQLSPAGLANARKTLTNNGKRAVSKLYLICNPLDEAQYVDPAMMILGTNGVWVNNTFMPIEKISDINVNQGDAFLTIDNAYTMGLRNIQINNYTETLALQHADLLMATAYGNGRADDDNTAVYFDVTRLTPAVPTVKTVTT